MMTIEKTPDGAWRISDIVNGHLFVRRYYGYTKKESMRLYKLQVKEETQ